ncbi:MAG TPA: hypothetical protein VGS19_23620 [Streptosporangiaceae bacterium]|nr:hypothetical protein [Streptosporangiaceae bacterium]
MRQTARLAPLSTTQSRQAWPQAIRAAHQAGDRAGALAAVPDEMVDVINVTGDKAPR